LIAAKWLGGFLVCFLVLWLGDRGEWLTGIAGLIAGYTTAASIGMGTVFFKLRKSRMGVRAL
jgi:TM2 domain-containing membrane protein YozV